MPFAALTLSVSLQIMIVMDSSSSFSKCILEELGAKLQFGFQNLGNVAREHICHSLVKYFSSRKIHPFVDVSFSSNIFPGCKMFATWSSDLNRQYKGNIWQIKSKISTNILSWYIFLNLERMFADKPAASLSDCYLGLLRILFVKQTTYATSETAMLGLIEWVEYNGFSTCLLARPGFLWKGLSFTTLPSPFKSYSIHSNINVWKYISLSRLPSDENGDLI